MILILGTVPLALGATKYQDAKWFAAADSDVKSVTNDMTGIDVAMEHSDTQSLSTYGGYLYTDSQKAIDDSNLYDVSPHLQDAKDEYNSAMEQAEWAGAYYQTAIKEYDKGNEKNAKSDLTKATQSKENYAKHLYKLYNLLKNDDKNVNGSVNNDNVDDKNIQEEYNLPNNHNE